MDITTGQPESHPSLLPLDASQSPATARPAEVVPGQLSGPTIPARDTVTEYAAPLAAAEREIAAAQSAGMTAENDRRSGYHTGLLPTGANYGDVMVLPPVPDAATVPASSDWYLGTGDTPLPED